MIKNVIFDVGKVLVDWNPLSTMEELGFSKKKIEELYSALFTSGAWLEEDRGIKSREEMYDFLASQCPKYSDDIKLFYDHATDSVRLMAYTHEWISSLKEQGYKVYVLSNFGDFAWHKAVKLGVINFLDMLDGYLVSYEIKQIKPEPGIYNELLSRYNLKSEECIFFDDSKPNIIGAEAVGIHGILFTDYEKAKADFDEYTKSSRS